MRIGEGAAKFLWPITPSIKHTLSAEIGRRFCGQKYQICVIGESAASFVAHNSKYQRTLSAEVWRRFCGPNISSNKYALYI